MLRQGHPCCPSMTQVQATLSAEDRCKEINLMPYTNMGCYTVQENAAVMRCHLLFRTMGLRHLPVLAEDNTISGMITRKDLVDATEAAHDLAAESSEGKLSEATTARPSEGHHSPKVGAQGSDEHPASKPH